MDTRQAAGDPAVVGGDQPEVGEGVVDVAVIAGADQNPIRSEGGDDGNDYLRPGPPVDVPGRSGRQGNVDRRSGGFSVDVRYLSGEGIEVRLMEGDVEDARIFGQHRLSPVAVVYIPVEDGDLLSPGPQGGSSHRHVVEQAETHSPRTKSMMSRRPAQREPGRRRTTLQFLDHCPHRPRRPDRSLPARLHHNRVHVQHPPAP